MTRIPGLGVVPGEWTTERAKWLLGRQRRNVRADDGIVTAFRDGQVTLRENRRTGGFTNAIQEIGYQGIRRGDLVVHGMDGFAGAIGVSDSDGKASPVVHAYQAKMGMDVRYLAYVLRTMAINGYVATLAKGIRERSTAFDSATLGSVLLPVPPPEEQRRIADFLDAQTARIDTLARLRRKQDSVLEERYFSAISELLTPGIGRVGQRHHVWPWLPAELHTVRLGYLARVQSGVTVHGAREQSSDDAEFPYLRVANVQGERVDLAEIKQIRIPKSMAMRCMLRPGDVVMTEANGNPDNLGRGAVWHGRIPRMVHQNHVFAIRGDRQRIVPEYLAALLATAHGRRYFRFTSTQVGIATTSSAKVLDFPVPDCSMSKQREVVSEYESLKNSTSRARDALDRQLALLTERRQSLITAAVTGQFDVSTASGRNVTE
ncbi:hypothetical protein JJV70_03375 [Streptomyces sp. JJ66]|uniref:restriction endonuclease subunit S n=1 Tax=Streptomyces sp. JJ66 TaxID=2803843 RepID=UPI001C5A16DF|nr:hypothetical protein [Streptomyces sp. JJ66]MBW1601158.1 hypothetical protein [Streptomyces sp. JJ66]